MIRIGPAGWVYKDWNGIVYPAKRQKSFDAIAFLAQYFDTIEINSTFYGPARSAAVTDWAQRVAENPRFRFTAKMFGTLTHKRNATTQDELDFKTGISPLMEAGRLGTLLLQFPWSFRYSPENRAYITELHRRFASFRRYLRFDTPVGQQKRCWNFSETWASALVISISRYSIVPSSPVPKRRPVSVMSDCTAGIIGTGSRKPLFRMNAMTICIRRTNSILGYNDEMPQFEFLFKVEPEALA